MQNSPCGLAHGAPAHQQLCPPDERTIHCLVARPQHTFPPSHSTKCSMRRAHLGAAEAACAHNSPAAPCRPGTRAAAPPRRPPPPTPAAPDRAAAAAAAPARPAAAGRLTARPAGRSARAAKQAPRRPPGQRLAPQLPRSPPTPLLRFQRPCQTHGIRSLPCLEVCQVELLALCDKYQPRHHIQALATERVWPGARRRSRQSRRGAARR
jgi:hypothetical protein